MTTVLRVAAAVALLAALAGCYGPRGYSNPNATYGSSTGTVTGTTTGSMSTLPYSGTSSGTNPPGANGPEAPGAAARPSGMSSGQ